MFALAAVVAFAVAFVLKLVGGDTGDVDLVILGLLFMGLHMLVGLWVPLGPRK
jgi:hypothetical protein